MRGQETTRRGGEEKNVDGLWDKTKRGGKIEDESKQNEISKDRKKKSDDRRRGDM